MWSQNLISVTLGNIVGGAVFVGVTYFVANLCGREASGKVVEAAPVELSVTLAPEAAPAHARSVGTQPAEAGSGN